MGDLRPMSKVASQQLLRQVRSQIFGQRTPRHIWHKIATGQLSQQEINEFADSWYYMPDIRKMGDPLYQDSKTLTNEARTERLKRRGKGPPTKGAGKRAQRR